MFTRIKPLLALLLAAITAIVIGTITLLMMTTNTPDATKWIAVTPTMIPGNQLALVTVTASVLGLNQRATRRISLIDAQNDWGTPLADLGPMYDDGTHGDNVTGDKIYTTQVTLQGPDDSYRYLRTYMRKRWLAWPVQSDIFATVTIYGPNSAEYGLQEFARILQADQIPDDLTPWVVENNELWKKIQGLDAKKRQQFASAFRSAQTVEDWPDKKKIYNGTTQSTGVKGTGYDITFTRMLDGTWRVSEWDWNETVVN